MKRSFLNPLTIFIGICAVVIAVLLWWWGRGESIETISKILFAPFLLDINKGVGEASAEIFRWVTLCSYITVLVFVVMRYFASAKAFKATLSIFGIIFTIVHFSIIGLGYLTTGLH